MSQLTDQIEPAAENTRAMLLRDGMLAAIVIGHKAENGALCYNTLPGVALQDVKQMLLDVLRGVQNKIDAECNLLQAFCVPGSGARLEYTTLPPNSEPPKVHP